MDHQKHSNQSGNLKVDLGSEMDIGKVGSKVFNNSDNQKDFDTNAKRDYQKHSNQSGNLKVDLGSERDSGNVGSKVFNNNDDHKDFDTNAKRSNRRVSAGVVTSEPNGDPEQRGPTSHGWQGGEQQENKENEGCCCGLGGGGAKEETPVEEGDAETVPNNENSADSRAKPEHPNDNNRGFNSTTATAKQDTTNGRTGTPYRNEGVVGKGMGGGGGGYDVFSSDRFESGDDYYPGGGDRNQGNYNNGGERRGNDHSTSNGERRGGEYNNSSVRHGGDYNSGGGGRGGYGDR